MRPRLPYIVLLFSLLLAAAPSRAASRVGWRLDSLELKGAVDSLEIDGRWIFSDAKISSNAALVFYLSLEGRETAIGLRPVVVYGKKREDDWPKAYASNRQDEVALWDIGPSAGVDFHEVFPIVPGMDTLKAVVTVYEWSKFSRTTVRSVTTVGTYICPPAPGDFSFTWEDAVPDFMAEDYRELEYSFPIVFEQGHTRFDRGYSTNVTNYGRLLSAVRNFTSGPRFRVRSSSISLYVSPGGKSSESVRLSKQRSLTLFEALRKDGCFKRYTPDRIGMGEDWDGVRQWVSKSRYAGDVRLDEILSWTSGGDAQAGAIRSEKPAVWEILESDCFPGLGKAVFKVSFRPLTFSSTTAILPVFEETPEALSPGDFYRLAGLYEKGSEEWLAIVTAGSDYNPGSEELAYNAVMSLCDAGYLNRASVYLRRCGNGPKASYAKAYWLYQCERYLECLDMLDVLSTTSFAYQGIYMKAYPYIMYIYNGMRWERIN